MFAPERSSARTSGKERARIVNGPRDLLNRPGEPDEIAAGALYLAGDESSFVTATDLLIDGGYIAFKDKIGAEGRPVFSCAASGIRGIRKAARGVPRAVQVYSVVVIWLISAAFSVCRGPCVDAWGLAFCGLAAR